MTVTRLWIRILLSAFLIIAWLVGAGVGGPYFGKVGEVSSNDQTSYLPESADATTVQKELAEFSDSNAIPAVVVLVSDNPLGDDGIAELQPIAESLTNIEGVVDEISPLIPSEDGLAAQLFVPVDSDGDVGDTVSAMSE